MLYQLSLASAELATLLVNPACSMNEDLSQIGLLRMIREEKD